MALDGECDIECASLVLHVPANVGIVVPTMQEMDNDNDPDAPPIALGNLNVDVARDVIRISENYDRLRTRQRTVAFRQPLRIVVEAAAVGQKIPVHYRLHGRNLRYPISGKLYIICSAR